MQEQVPNFIPDTAVLLRVLVLFVRLSINYEQHFCEKSMLLLMMMMMTAATIIQLISLIKVLKNS
jgi:hypothetical protein